MKRTNFLLLVAGLMASIFVMTGCTANRDGFLTTEQLLTGEGPDPAISNNVRSAEPQLEPFDRALEESRKQVEVKLAQEKEPQLEPFDKALEDSREQCALMLAEKEWTERVYSLAK